MTEALITAATAATAAHSSTGQDLSIRYDIDADGIVVLTLDDPQSRANTMNEVYASSMNVIMDRLYAERDDITGVAGTWS